MCIQIVETTIRTDTTEGAAAFGVRGHGGEHAVCGACQDKKKQGKSRFREKAVIINS